LNLRVVLANNHVVDIYITLGVKHLSYCFDIKSKTCATAPLGNNYTITSVTLLSMDINGLTAVSLQKPVVFFIELSAFILSPSIDHEFEDRMLEYVIHQVNEQHITANPVSNRRMECEL